MIQQIQIYKTDCTDPYQNIATEKLLLETVEDGCCILYLWRNKNTVVIGRNQNAWAECRTSLLEQENGHLARRLSGGGAVYHDLGNLNFTFIMHQRDYDLDKQLSVIEAACSLAGIQVERSGRNDLLADGHKFSGNAFYHSQGRAYHHGTLLVSADMDMLSRYLTPPKAKLEAKGVASVRSRVINLRDLSPSLTCERLADRMTQAFSQIYGLQAQPRTLSSDQTDTVNTYAQELGSWDWLYGQKLPFTLECNERFPWGSFQIQMQVQSGLIHTVQVYSDSMDWQLAENVSNTLRDCRFDLPSVTSALKNKLHNSEICADICNLLVTQVL